MLNKGIKILRSCKLFYKNFRPNNLKFDVLRHFNLRNGIGRYVFCLNFEKMLKMMRFTQTISVLVLGLSMCACGKSTAPKGVMPPIAVEVVDATSVVVPNRRSFIGQISGKYEALIQPRVSGYLLSRHFGSGMPVKRGDLLFVIDDALLRTTLLSAQASLESARAQAIEAKNNYERAIPLVEIDAISESQFDQYTAQYRAAEANVRSAEQSLRNARLEVGYCRIYAPIDGFVEAPQAHVGDFVGVGTAFSELTKVVNVDTVSVDVTIPMSQYMSYVEQSVPIYENRELLSDITLRRSDGEIYPFEGIYDYTRTELTDGAGTLAIVVDFPNPDYRLKAGQFARIEANVGTARRCVVVPQQCIEQRQGESSLWVVGADSVAEYRKVEVGQTVGAMWVVEQGLAEGEQVVSSGQQKLHRGAKVSPRKTE